MKQALIVVATIALSSSAAVAATIYSEDFNNPGFQGPALSLNDFSDKIGWNPTNYYYINNFDGWTFTGGAYWATNLSGDGAVLLNENGPTSASTTVSGLTAGVPATLRFDVWGDNEPGGTWVLKLNINGTSVLTLTGVDQAPGTNPGATETINFTPSASSALLYFYQASPSAASPIIDNVQASQAPLPASWTMLVGGLAGLGYLARRAGKRRDWLSLTAA